MNIQTAHTRDLGPAFEQCRAVLRRLDRDRYYSSLFAASPQRDGLQALYAFAAEIARVRDVVSDPLPGEMRLQWWRDLLEGEIRGDAASNPIAAALLRTIERYRLPAGALIRMIEARSLDLYDDPIADFAELEGYCGDTASALIRLGAIILAEGREPGAADAAGHAGVAFALTGLLRALPWHVARGRLYLPEALLRAHGLTREEILARADTPRLRDALAEMRGRARGHLGETRRLIGALKPAAAPAFLHVALVEPYLDRMERKDYAPFTTAVDIGDLRRLLILTRQAFRARRAGSGGARQS